MASLPDLVRYLSQGTSIVWVGAGASVGAGLPTGASLATEYLEHCRTQQQPGFARVEHAYRNEAFPEMYLHGEHVYGRKHLIDFLRTQLSGYKTGAITYTSLVDLDPSAFVTTNFEDALFDHASAVKSTQQFLNTPTDLASVEIGVTPAVVHLHGHLDSPDTVIVTQADYDKYYADSAQSYFQDWIKMILAHDRVLFVGYSMADEEVNQLLTRQTATLRRMTPHYCIMADARPDFVEQMDRRLNVQVISYRATGGNHQELDDILATLSRFISASPLTGIAIDTDTRRKLQSLYLYVRSSSADSDSIQIDAFKSVLLRTTAEIEEEYSSVDRLKDETLSVVGLTGNQSTGVFEGAVADLVRDGWLQRREGGDIRLSDEGRRNVQGASDRFDRLLDTFRSEIKVALMTRVTDLDEVSLDRSVEIALATIVDIFAIRGEEMVDTVLDRSDFSPQGVADVLEIILGHAKSASSPAIRFGIINVVMDTLQHPNDVQAALLRYFAAAFFSIHALKMDPIPRQILQEFADTHSLLLDDNVLIPLLAPGEERHETALNTLGDARKAGMHLFTTSEFMNQAQRHIEWAIAVVEEYGPLSIEVYNAATGQAGYRQNALLEGFIESAENGGSESFLEYLQSKIPGAPRTEALKQHLEDLGVDVIQVGAFRERLDDGSHPWGDILEQMRSVYGLNDIDASSDDESLASEGYVAREPERATRRAELMADAYTLISRWPEHPDCPDSEAPNQLTLLTLGSRIERAFTSGELSSIPKAYVLLDGLGHLLRFIGKAPNSPEPSFHASMLSGHFRTADRFIGNDRYESFFSPLLREYEERFADNFDLYQLMIEGLSENDLEQYESLQRMQVVDALDEQLVENTDILQLRVNELEEERDGMKDRLADLERKERGRQEHLTRLRAGRRRQQSAQGDRRRDRQSRR